MKKETVLYLLMGASIVQYLINGFLKGNLWVPLLIGISVVCLLCVVPNKILSEKLSIGDKK